MAVIHQTTMSPTKLELLAAWLPGQPWYAGTGQAQDLVRAGGFRLDDPQGEVGIELMAVTDQSGQCATTYHVPLTYRANALEEASKALVGTAEHGVLGRRWVYDGTADPVFVAQLVALMQGEAQAQAQAVSDTQDTSVASTSIGRSRLSVSGPPMQAANDAAGTEIEAPVAAANSAANELIVRVIRLLSPVSAVPGDEEDHGTVSANWRLPDGTQAHGRFAEARIR